MIQDVALDCCDMKNGPLVLLHSGSVYTSSFVLVSIVRAMANIFVEYQLR